MAKILVVEDDKVLSSAYQMILEKDGHTVKVVFDGAEAIKQAAVFKPNIILLDLLMPIMGGIDFLAAYETQKHPKVRVIVLSNMGDEKLVDQARELGAHKYIVKAHTTPGQLSLMINRIAAKLQ